MRGKLFLLGEFIFFKGGGKLFLLGEFIGCKGGAAVVSSMGIYLL